MTHGKHPKLSDCEKQLLREYYSLAACHRLTEEQSKRIDQILAHAESSPCLAFYIEEADHDLAHQMEDRDLQDLQNQQAFMREYFTPAVANPQILQGIYSQSADLLTSETPQTLEGNEAKKMKQLSADVTAMCTEVKTMTETVNAGVIAMTQSFNALLELLAQSSSTAETSPRQQLVGQSSSNAETSAGLLPRQGK